MVGDKRQYKTRQKLGQNKDYLSLAYGILKRAKHTERETNIQTNNHTDIISTPMSTKIWDICL